MGDDTISFGESSGIKALDSNEIRRKHRERRASLISDSTVLLLSLGSEPKNPNYKRSMSDFSARTPSKSPLPGNLYPCSSGTGSRSPKSGTAQKLQQALFEEGLLMEAEVRARHEQQQENPSLSRQIQQAVVEEGLVLEAEAQAQGTHVTTSQHQEVPFSNHNPKTLYNARGIPYLEGDPNLGYSEEDTKPMRPLASERYSVSSIPPQAIPHQGSNNPTPITNVHKPKPKNWASLLQSQSPSMELKLDFYPELFKVGKHRFPIIISSSNIPSTNIPSSGTTFEHNYNEMHCPDQLSQQKPPSGSFKEGQGSDKELNSFTQQMNSEAPLSRSAAKKAAKIAAKLRDKEPPDPGSDIKLMKGGSTKTGQTGRQKSYTKSSSNRSGK
ncbi:hypothetical protein RHMOL_Rhmol11G0044500 [Rhododendron molle]|uniref:Uncharacterized protein n=1 Tax=Rhododendron molle TaxID=49168 RepID=A0ACC0LP12_RHOML|nr:hypothetical protein RHMOL_Rhmol11G0044500 [Rhododendron molle]